MMQRRRVSDDLTFSVLAWGAWRLQDSDHLQGPRDVLRLIEFLIDHGVTTIDHADIYGDYGCEAAFGAALALAPALRERMEIVTKCDIVPPDPARPDARVKHYDTSARHIIDAAERSLRNLGIAHIDVLLLHRPDPLMDANEVAEAFARLRTAGKVRHFGVSNFTPAQFDLLQSRLDAPLVTNQIECSPLATDALTDGALDQMQSLGRTAMFWSPLGGLFDPDDARARRVRDALTEVGRRIGCNAPATVATAWLLRLPCAPVVIAGSMRTGHLESMIQASALTLDRQDWFQIYEASMGRPAP
ncbi:aldo/keto reductase [Varunaivibrio sulfuroxidans]|uniref:Putative oxidoreductase n=1 Tax=Varunaivibrio sulfuroxidans TaxID=1773489 RepID=A0A4R3J7I7_9PROT|nr:aldo/keto reductase [Varunaivibrio sulfuroxidans]TCS60863.1 putative oxidoreductase [Varunaivibrio sulfuroxidans]WES31723.1 aldo/keto reductase [Varunaivibrio sulfuroxidans]